jgi:hypothetical protein
MKQKRVSKQADGRAKAPIKTTVFEVMQELTKLTKNDNLVLAAFRDIFDSHKVTTIRSLAPVRVVANGRSSYGRVQRRSSW